jgi:glucose-6-phosphate dehydrogenase assembly protein OpcA
MTSREAPLLPEAEEVPFAELGRALARASAAGSAHHTRSLTATIVAIGTRPRLVEAAAALHDLTDGGGIRAILIATGGEPAPLAHVAANAVAVEGLRESFVNNAVASLRLSSLPTFVWWRGGGPDLLAGVADLADRVVVDVEDPQPVWSRAGDLFERTAMTDLRWARLTPWRALMAHLFDIDEVRAAVPRFEQLVIRCSDRAAGRLFAGWIRSCLRRDSIAVEILHAAGPDTFDSIQLGDERTGLLLRRRPGRACVETVARVDGRLSAERTTSLRSEGSAALLREELRVRSRDLAFERAVAAAGAVA